MCNSRSCRCTVCNLELPEHYYIKENLPYCKDHYYELVAHKCYQCTDYITGPTVVRYDTVYIYNIE